MRLGNSTRRWWKAGGSSRTARSPTVSAGFP